VHTRRQDGIYVINLEKTWEKLQMAARIIVAIENPQDVVVLSARPYGQRAVRRCVVCFAAAQCLQEGRRVGYMWVCRGCGWGTACRCQLRQLRQQTCGEQRTRRQQRRRQQQQRRQQRQHAMVRAGPGA
jgi:hypothetical protein